VQFIAIECSGPVLCLSIVDSGLRVERCLGGDVVQFSYRYFWDFRFSRRKYWDVTSYSLQTFQRNLFLRRDQCGKVQGLKVDTCKTVIVFGTQEVISTFA
jgi:hypothetical protein